MYNYPFSTTTTVDFSEARSNLSQILNKIYFDRGEVVITKRKIPIAVISRYEEKQMVPVVKKNLDSPLFGIWKKDKRSAVTIANGLRKKMWRGV